MAVTSVNDPGFLAQLSAQAAQRTPLANQRAANRAIGAGRSGPSSQIPVAMQTRDPYFLNPGGAPTMQPRPMGELGPAGSTRVAFNQPPTPGAPARPTMNLSNLGGNGTAFPGQGTLPPASSLPPGGSPIPQGPVGGAGGGGVGLVDDAARAGANVADDLVAQAAGAGGRTVSTAGRAAGAMLRTPVVQNAPKLAGMFSNLNLPKGMGGAGMSLARLGAGGGVAMAGQAVSGMLDGMDIGGENSNSDQAISGGVLGASIGAGGAIALGLGAGPVGWAALGGAALFAGGKMLFGNNKDTATQMTEATDKTRQTIQELSQMYGLDASATSELMMQYDVTTRLYQDSKDKDGLKTYLTGLSSQLPALMLQEKQEAELEAQEQKRFEGMLATQAQFAPIFQQSLNQAQLASAGATATANEVSQRLEATAPNLASLVRSGAAVSEANANRLYAGYAAQMAMGPQANYDMNNLAGLQAQVEQQALLDQYMQSAAG